MPFKRGQEWNGNAKGRPKKFTIKDFLTPDDVHDLVLKAQEMAKEGKTDMIKLLLEHALGKPVQKHAGPDEGDGFNPILVKFVEDKTPTDGEVVVTGL